MVEIRIGPTNGSVVSVKYGMHRFSAMASSIIATSRIGRENDLSTNAMITKIAAMEIALTTLKSRSVQLIKSFVQGASPMSMPPSSYFLRIAFSSSICWLTALEEIT